jgi:hypothetical protein
MGTLIEAWAGQKSFRKAEPASDPPPEDPGEAKLSYLSHLPLENRHGLVVDAELAQAKGQAEREAAANLLERIPGSGHITVGADKAYDPRDFVAQARLRVPPRTWRRTTRNARAPSTAGRPTCRLCHQSTIPQARGGGFRVDEDHWPDAEDEA